MQNQIEHVIVLMLENRSFDHMLGYLDHPDPNYPNLVNSVTNPYIYDQSDISVNKEAEKTIFKGPNHHHDGVMRQIFNNIPSTDGYKNQTPNNLGFVNEYEDYVNTKEGERGHGPSIMKCFNPDQIPVLSTLAKEFAVCTNWHCSVPGMTWPNRAYLHTGTSEGEVNIKKRPYKAETIFERLQDKEIKWRAYIDGSSHLWVYPKLAKLKHRYRIHKMKKFYKHVKSGKLGAYNFIEPDHFGKNATSQHPMNSETKDDQAGIKAFIAAEELIANVYKSLLANPDVFKKTLLVITYDEHGGFFDRVPPPETIPPDTDFYKEKGQKFNFDRLGVRVPTVLVSPLIKKGTIDNTLYDHTSVIRSLCKRFLPEGNFLKERDRQANDFWSVINLTSPRNDLPSVSAESYEDIDIVEFMDAKDYPLDEMQEALIDITFEIDEALTYEKKSSDKDEKGAYSYLNDQWWGEANKTGRKRFKGDKQGMIKFTHFVAERFQEVEEDD